MATRNGNGNEARLPIRDTIVAIALVVSLGGAFWTIMQTQFAAVKENQEAFAKSIERMMNTNVQGVKDLFGLFQAQIDRRETDSLRRDEASIKRMDAIQAELDRRRNEFVGVKEFAEFGKLVTNIHDRIKVLEATRPTTGELQAVGNGNKEQITKLEERVRSLEDNLRRIQPRSNQGKD